MTISIIMRFIRRVAMAFILLCLFLFALLTDRKLNITETQQAARYGD